MLLKEFIPAPEVQEFVRLFRIVHFVFGKNDPLPFKAYPPRPEHCLAFFPYDREQLQPVNSHKKIENLPAILYGQPLSVTNRYVGRQFLVFQVIFQPGALYRLTGIPASLFTDEYLDAETVFGTGLREVNEKLFHADSYTAMLQTGHEFVKGLMRKSIRPPHAIETVSKLLLQHDGKVSIDWLAKESCLSTRQFERKFKERAGIGAALFARIIRFDKAFLLKNRHPDWDWLRIAVECDFYDYQHLAKTYREFTGLSPASFHELENKSPERKFGLSETYYSGA